MDLEDCKSCNGVLLMLNNGPIAWLSRKQPCIASSTTKAKYLAAHVATKELLWERRLLAALGYPQCNPTPMFSDNQPTIRLVRNPEQHQKTKHIDVLFLVIREHQTNRELHASTFLRISNWLMSSLRLLHLLDFLLYVKPLVFINLHSSRNEWELQSVYRYYISFILSYLG